MSLDLEAIRKRANLATEGPWFGSAGGLYVYGATPGDEVARTNRPADARFIQHARTDVPDLVAEIERLRELYSAMTGHNSTENGSVVTWP